MYTLRVVSGITEESAFATFYIQERGSFIEAISYEGGFRGERFKPQYSSEEIEAKSYPAGVAAGYSTIESARRAAAALQSGVRKKAEKEYLEYLEGLEVE